MSNDASPRAKRRKNKVKLKLSWGTPTKEERIAQQLDDFISDVIESAKREYLSNERQDSFNGNQQNLYGDIFLPPLVRY